MYLLGDKKLGEGYILSEDGKYTSIVKSTTKPYRGSGLEVIPPTVTKFKANKNYIIALSIDIETKVRNYWIINKSITINLADCKDQASCDSVLRSNVEGPLDSVLFNKKLKENSIPLSFDN